MGTVEVHLLYVSNFFINLLILKMIFVTILLWMKAAQGLYVNKDDNNDDLQSFSILQNFNSTLRDDKGLDLPMMTLMSEHDDKSDNKPMKKRKFKKMILKKRIMRQKAKEQAFANMLADLNLDKMNMAEGFKVMETLAEHETENLDYEVVEMHSEANDQASPEHDDSVADHEGKASGSPDMDDDSDAEESDSEDSDSNSESDSSDSDSDSDSEESDHELEAADEEESGENDHDDSDGDSSDSSSDSDSDSSDSDGPDYYNGDEYEYSYQWYPHEEYVYNYEWAYTP